MKRAWKNNFQAYDLAQTKTNAHRLLLFYSIECGLKAAIMKRDSISSTLACPKVIDCGHNINRLLDTLNVEQNLRVPNKIKMISSREASVGEINQMWRYGGEAISSTSNNNPTDKELESSLLKISEWIKQELNQ
ncbi:hypothetical protein VB774_18390 [Pseudanabaena galeata UHCC 0370]|uniref:HEPN domain-containing protein n=1 Tax=Pseudanabaena galeata UHCC 0370 TaxID=3110310 RepID=A0ABU5TN19_9CYAN|nr:hypothetical protein [Pseudanabaena galeata]MEA5479595.1 hypothetical protein [Pseudanabaena galeata UHCC 0370]